MYLINKNLKLYMYIHLFKKCFQNKYQILNKICKKKNNKKALKIYLKFDKYAIKYLKIL